MKNDNFYEDDEIVNEAGAVDLARGALSLLGAGASKGLNIARKAKPSRENLRSLLLKDPDKKVSLKTISKLKDKLDNLKTTSSAKSASALGSVGNSKVASRLSNMRGMGPLKTIGSDVKAVWDASNKKGKAAMVGAGLVAGNEIYDKGENTKAAIGSVVSGTKSVAKLTFRELPAAAKNSVNLILSGIAGGIGGMGVAVAGFNHAVRTGRLTMGCILRPSSCEATIVKQVTDYAKRTGGAVKGGVSKVTNASTGAKVAGVAGTLAAGVVAAKVIKDALERKDWYNNGCEKIDNPDKRQACLAHVKKKQKKDLMSKLKRCALANNPAKCEAIVKQKLSDME